MEFANSIIGGSDELVRDGIQSRNYLPGVSGWRISRDGNAEFNNITARGDVIVQKDDNIIHLGIEPALDSPAVMFYDGGLPNPASISGSQLVDEVEILMTTSGNADTNKLTMFSVGEQASFHLRIGEDYDQGWFFSYIDPEWPGGIDAFELHGMPAGIYHALLDQFYPIFVDGKVHPGAITDTNVSSTTDVNILGANIVDVTTTIDRAYRCDITLRVAGSVLNDRVVFKLKKGSTQIAQDRIYRITGATATFVDVNLRFLWRADDNETIANLNLAMNRFSGSGTITARVEADAYMATVEEIGTADRIGNL